MNKETGNSYPDMSTLIKVAKVLDCTLEDILDDDAIGSNNFEKNDKFNINKWIKEVLEFITKTYNMFWSMKFKVKIKCILECSIIICILCMLSLLLGMFLKETILEIFTFLPYNLYSYIFSIFKMLYMIVAFIASMIIFIHLFKIRYLDYYITIEDDEVEEKQIEEDKTENKKELKVYNNKKSQEKIIIRDPKHTTYSFFSGLGKIIMFLLKIFVFFILIFSVLSFIFLTFIGTVSIIWLKYGIVFLGSFICILGALLVNYCFIELMYKFIFNRMYNFKRIFIIFITGLLISGIGIGIGIGFADLSKFSFSNNLLKDKSTVLNIEMHDNLKINDLDTYYKDKVIIDNSVDNIVVEVKYIDGIEPVIDNTYDDFYYINYNVKEFNIIKFILNDIKNKNLREYDLSSMTEISSIRMSKSNYDKIISNINRYNNINNYYYE